MDSTFLLGQHSSQLVALTERAERIETSVTSMNGKLDAIAMTLAERRGERKTIAAIATLAGGVGSLIITVLLKVVFR